MVLLILMIRGHEQLSFLLTSLHWYVVMTKVALLLINFPSEFSLKKKAVLTLILTLMIKPTLLFRETYNYFSKILLDFILEYFETLKTRNT